MKFPINPNVYNKLGINKEDTITKRLKSVTEGDYINSPDNDIILNAMYNNINRIPVNHIKRLLRKIVYHIKVHEDEVFFFIDAEPQPRFYKLSFHDFDNLRYTELTHYSFTKYLSENNNTINVVNNEITYPISNFFEILPIILNKHE